MQTFRIPHRNNDCLNNFMVCGMLASETGRERKEGGELREQGREG